jgi:tRNA-splicing ligase RtcB
MQKPEFSGPLERVSDCCWRIPRSYKTGMRVDGLIYASDELMEHVRSDQAAEQVANVAFLPGIQVASLAMPDIHWGYGFSIGGVCATDPNEGGVISPGGVGYDINCGVRLIRSKLFHKDVGPHIESLIEELFQIQWHRKQLRRLLGVVEEHCHIRPRCMAFGFGRDDDKSVGTRCR